MASDMKRAGGKQRTKAVAQADAPAKPTRRRGKLLVLLSLAALLIWFAPFIVAHSGLLNWVLKTALKVDGTISCSSASLGWLSPPVINELQVADPQGKSILEVTAIGGQKSLLGLLFNRADLGSFTIAHPVLNLVVREDGTNLEDAFAALLAEPSSGERAAVNLNLVNGVAIIDDVPAGRHFRLENIDVDLKAGSETPLECTASTTLATDARPVSLKVALRASRLAGSVPEAGEVKCQIESLPLNLVEPFLRRVLPGAALDGRLSTNLECSWDYGPQGKQGSARGELAVTGLRLAAEALSGDELRIERLRVPCNIAQTGDTLTFNQLGLESELAQIAVTGSARTGDFSTSGILASLARERYQVAGRVDLARLAAMLPNTLSVREGTQITRGQLALDMRSGPAGNEPTWTGHLEATDVAGVSGGRPLTWQKPVALDFAVSNGEAGLVIKQARCVSSFLQLDATGTLDNLTATAQYDLARLAEELGQFFDMRNVRLAGQGTARLDWRRTGANQCAAHGDFQARGFQLVAAGRRPWQEENLSAQVDLTAELNDRVVKQIHTANLQLKSNDETLLAGLTAPVTDLERGPWPVEIKWQGQLSDWLPRLESWVNLAGWDLAGAGSVDARLSYSPDGVDIADAKASLDRFHLWGGGLYIDEPRLDVAGSAKWNAAAMQFASPAATISAGALRVRLADATFKSQESGMVASGVAAYEGDLNQFGRWLQDPRAKPTWRAAGRLTGRSEISTSGGVTTARTANQVDQLELADLRGAETKGNTAAPANLWREARVALNLNGNYDAAGDVLALETAEVQSNGLRCQASGQVAELSGRRNMDVRGKIDYDWQAIAPLWRLIAPDGVAIAGRGSREFYARGPWPTADKPETWRQFVAEAGVDWSQAEAYGLELGKGELAAKLEGGIVQIKPLEFDVSEGHVSLLSQVKLHPAPAELRLGKSELAREIKITPQVCAQALKFVAPVLAEATVAEGAFSINLSGARFPLADMAGGDCAGQLIVHSAEVKPGPMAEQLVTLGKELAALGQNRLPGDTSVGTLLSLEKQNVDFRLVDRRVYHRGLRFQAGNVPVTTHGSVGLDETISLIAEIPMQESWIGSNPGLAGLKNQTLEIPIEGTLKQPRIDRRALPQIAGKLIGNTAKGFLLDRVNKQLDKLIPAQK